MEIITGMVAVIDADGNRISTEFKTMKLETDEQKDAYVSMFCQIAEQLSK